MTESKNNHIIVELKENQKVVYEKKTILGGIISWSVKLYAERFGSWIEIAANDKEDKIDKVYVNGREFREIK